MRKKLRERGVESLKVVWSDEPPLPVKNFIGSAAFVPSVAGLILAGEVINDLLS